MKEVTTNPLFVTASLAGRVKVLHSSLVYFIIYVLCFMCSPTLSAQVLGSWQIYPAYTVCTQNVPAGKQVFALMESKLMAYDTEDESLRTFDWMRQLNDVSVTAIDYCEEVKRLIIIYDNGNIDLLNTDDDTDVINLSHLKNSTLQGKEITALTINGHNAYLSTGFGLVVIDIKEGVISKSYQLGLSATSCAVDGHDIWLGTTNGIWHGRQTDNLQDISNWTQVNTSLKPSYMLAFDNHVWTVVGNSIQVSSDGINFKTVISSFKPTYATVSDGQMILGNATRVHLFNAWDQQQTINGDFNWSCLTKHGDTYWASDGEEGLQAYNLTSEGTFQLKTPNLHPNSPLHDYAFHLKREGDRLLVSGGNRHYTSTAREGTAMILEPDGTWRNFSAKAVTAAYPNERYRDVTNIAQDPTDTEHHFVGTTRSGIFEFRNGKCVGHIGLENSPLQSILPDNANPQWFTVADGLCYDPQGNLWILNCTEGRADTTVRIRRADGTWTGIPTPEVKEASTLDNIFFDSRGWAWINSRRMDQRGIYLLDYNQTIGSRTDDKRILRATITNQDGTSYSPGEFYCINEDKEGYIWVGTNEGPFVITDPIHFTDNAFTFEQVKVARTDGSGLADYLLSGLPILTIAIDGGNRKWFGTQGSGVYLMSADCQEQIHHFTTENSPLPSNDIFDINIDGRTGVVYFASSKGIASFTTDATDTVEDLQQDDLLVYPNPVGPDYNGPIAVRGLSKDAEVKIVSTTGQLIWSGHSTGGLFTWNGCNLRGQRVSSGIYHIIASTSDGDKAAATRITIIR